MKIEQTEANQQNNSNGAVIHTSHVPTQEIQQSPFMLLTKKNQNKALPLLFNIFQKLILLDVVTFSLTSKTHLRVVKSYISYYFGYITPDNTPCDLPEDTSLSALILTSDRLPFLSKDLKATRAVVHVEKYLHGTQIDATTLREMKNNLYGPEIWQIYVCGLIEFKLSMIEKPPVMRTNLFEDNELGLRSYLISRVMSVINHYALSKKLDSGYINKILINCFFSFNELYNDRDISHVELLKICKAEPQKYAFLKRVLPYLNKHYPQTQFAWKENLQLSGIKNCNIYLFKASLRNLQTSSNPNHIDFKTTVHYLVKCLEDFKEGNLPELINIFPQNFCTAFQKHSHKLDKLIAVGQLLGELFMDQYPKLTAFFNIKKNLSLALTCYLNVRYLHTDRAVPKELNAKIIILYQSYIISTANIIQNSRNKLEADHDSINYFIKLYKTAYTFFKNNSSQDDLYVDALNWLEQLKSRNVILGGKTNSNVISPSSVSAIESNENIQTLPHVNTSLSKESSSDISDDIKREILVPRNGKLTLEINRRHFGANSDDKLLAYIFEQLKLNSDIEAVHLDAYADFPFQELLEILSKRTNINYLDVTGLIKLEDWKALFLHIKENKFIIHLSIGYQDCSDSDSYAKLDNSDDLFNTALCDFLGNIEHLESLKFYGQKLQSEKFLKALSSVLATNSYLAKIRIFLSNILINKTTLPEIEKLLSASLSFLELSVDSDSKVTQTTLTTFTKLLENNKSLTHFGLCNLNQCSDSLPAENICQLLIALIKQKNIVGLNFSGSLRTLNDKLFDKICVALEQETNIKELYLNFNYFNDTKVKQLASVFKKKNNIELLDISENLISHDAVKELCDILSKYKNKLTFLNLAYCLNNKADYRIFINSICNYLNSSECQLSNLHIPSRVWSGQKNNALLGDMYNLVKHNTKLRRLAISDDIDTSALKKLIKLIERTRITTLVFRQKKMSLILLTELEKKLLINKQRLLEGNNNVNKETVPATNEPKKIFVPKASIETLKPVFEKLEIHVQWSSSPQGLSITFDNTALAQVTFEVLSTNKLITSITENSVFIANYFNLDESAISSLIILLEVGLQKAMKSTSDSEMQLSSYFKVLKNIQIYEDESRLTLAFSKNILGKIETDRVLGTFSEILKTKNIKSVVQGKQITISKNQKIDTQDLNGIATEFKKVITDYYHYTNSNSSFNDIQHKLQRKKVDKKKPKQDRPKSKPAKSASVTTASSQNKTSDKPVTVGKSDNNNNNNANGQKIELLRYGKPKKLPTDEKFESLLHQVNEWEAQDRLPSFCDKNMLLILSHYKSVQELVSIIKDEQILAYCLFYHSLRISELSNNYFREKLKVEYPGLCRSAYGTTTILADQSDFFVPDNGTNDSINALHAHSMSFLTVGKQILLDLFNDKLDIKTKLETGYNNVIFFNVFYPDGLSGTGVKLPVAPYLAKDPILVLQKIHNIAQFLATYLGHADIATFIGGNASSNIALCVAKAAIFFIGHFARILRDEHSAFCKKYLYSNLHRLDYSHDFESKVIDMLGQQRYFFKKEHLISNFDRLTEADVKQLSHLFALSDVLVLCIGARNIIRHNNEDEVDEVQCAFDEISISAVAYLTLFFITNENCLKEFDHVVDRFNMQMANTDSTQDINTLGKSLSKNVLNSNPTISTHFIRKSNDDDNDNNRNTL